MQRAKSSPARAAHAQNGAHRALDKLVHDRGTLLDMIDVIEQERRFNQAAALLALHHGERDRHEQKARQGALAIAEIRRKLARHERRAHLPVSQDQLDAYLDSLISIELDVVRDASNSLGAAPRH